MQDLILVLFIAKDPNGLQMCDLTMKHWNTPRLQHIWKTDITRDDMLCNSLLNWSSLLLDWLGFSLRTEDHESMVSQQFNISITVFCHTVVGTQNFFNTQKYYSTRCLPAKVNLWLITVHTEWAAGVMERPAHPWHHEETWGPESCAFITCKLAHEALISHKFGNWLTAGIHQAKVPKIYWFQLLNHFLVVFLAAGQGWNSPVD